MSVAKITEISAESPESFQKALEEGIKRAAKTLKQIQSAWIEDQQVTIANGRISSYRVHLKITFVLED